VTGGAVDWSPDGRHVATEGPEGSDGFDIRDADTGDVVRSLAVPGSDVADLQYNPDGTVLATTDRDGTTHLWNPATGELLTSIEGSGLLARSPSFSPDGSLIAVASPTESRVRIFDVATGSVVLDTRSVRGANATSWSPDGTRLAVASAHEPVGAVLDVSSGDIISTLDGHFAALSDIEWSPDGLAIATSGNDGSARVFSAESGSAQMVIPGHGAAVGAVGWSASSTNLATASADGTVKLWGVIEGGGRALAVLTADDMRSGVDDVAFSPDGTKLIVGGRSGVTSVWDIGLDAGSEIATLPAAAYAVGTAEFDAGGEVLYATSAGGRIAVWNTNTWELVRSLGPSGASVPVDTSPAQAPLGSPQDFMRIAPSPDGELVAAVSDASAQGLSAGRVGAFDTTTGEIVIDVTLGSHASDAHWSPDGDILAVAGRDDQGALVRMVDRSGTTVGQLRFGDVVVGVAGFDAARNTLIVWIEPPLGLYEPDIGRVEVWDWRSETLVRTIDVDAYVAVASPLGDLVAVGPHENAPDQTLAVWSTRTGERIATLDGHSGSPNHLAFTADGRRLAVAGGDGTTRIWNPITGELQLTLGGHLALVSAASFNPDGTQLATTSADGRVRIWALNTDTLLEVARQRVTRSLTDAECLRYLSQADCDK
jgi:WD40 repeat protein